MIINLYIFELGDCNGLLSIVDCNDCEEVVSIRFNDGGVVVHIDTRFDDGVVFELMLLVCTFRCCVGVILPLTLS